MEAVKVGEEDANGGIDANDPGKVEEIVHHDEHHGNAREGHDGTKHRLPEAALVERLGLLDA